jgi:hypothetical protein
MHTFYFTRRCSAPSLVEDETKHPLLQCNNGCFHEKVESSFCQMTLVSCSLTDINDILIFFKDIMSI